MKKIPSPNIWFKAKLSPLAKGIFTSGFYPKPKRGGAQYVYYTEFPLKTVVASRFNSSSIRLLTLNLAKQCLIPYKKATKVEMLKLNDVSRIIRGKIK